MCCSAGTSDAPALLNASRGRWTSLLSRDHRRNALWSVLHILVHFHFSSYLNYPSLSSRFLLHTICFEKARPTMPCISLVYIYYVCIYLSICTYVRLSLDPEGKARVQNGVSGSFWVPSSKSWRAQSQRSGQICHEVLSRETYYSSQVCRVCVALL